MKYPILFLCRLIYILFNFFVFLPFMVLIFILFCIWELKIKENWKGLKNVIIDGNFVDEDENYSIRSYGKEKLYYYKTPWDYLINNKQYRDNPDYNPDYKRKTPRMGVPK